MQSFGLSRPGVYAIRVEGHCYVGSSLNLRARWNAHRKDLRREKHQNRLLQEAFDRFGESALTFEVLAFVDAPESVVRAIEDAWFARVRPDLNLAPSAIDCTGVKLTTEARAKISEANRRRWAAVSPEDRRTATDVMREGITTGRLGAHHSDESKAKMRAAKLGKPGNAAGLRRSDETRARISAAMSGKGLSAKHRAAISASLTGKKRGPYKKKEQ